MPGFKGIDQMRKVEWSRKYLWDILLPDAPQPYNEWFPAQEVDVPEAIIKSKIFSAYNTQFKIPEGTDDKVIRVTYVDDVNNTLLNYHKTWMKSILGDDGFSVLPLKSVARRLIIQKLGLNREPLTNQTSIYWVYPDGNLNFSGSGESAPHTYNMTYVVVGESGARGS